MTMTSTWTKQSSWRVLEYLRFSSTNWPTYQDNPLSRLRTSLYKICSIKGVGGHGTWQSWKLKSQPNFLAVGPWFFKISRLRFCGSHLLTRLHYTTLHTFLFYSTSSPYLFYNTHVLMSSLSSSSSSESLVTSLFDGLHMVFAGLSLDVSNKLKSLVKSHGGSVDYVISPKVCSAFSQSATNSYPLPNNHDT